MDGMKMLLNLVLQGRKMIISNWIKQELNIMFIDLLCRNFPFFDINILRGLGTLSVHIWSPSLLGRIPKRAFLPTFMYCRPIFLGEPTPNNDVINFILETNELFKNKKILLNSTFILAKLNFLYLYFDLKLKIVELN